MYVDKYLLLCDEQALTASAASTNIINLAVDNNVGIGEPMAVVIVLDVAADATTGDETYSAALQCDDADTFGSATTLGTQTITRGDAAGTRYIIPVPPTTSSEQYLRLYFTLGGTTPTATVTAFLIPMNMISNYVAYADNISFS